jgi:hypothetical protein
MAIKNLRKTKGQLRHRGISGRTGGSGRAGNYGPWRRAMHSRHGNGDDQAEDYFNSELVKCQENDAPGKMFFRWDDDTGGYAYNEQHPIAKRIGPELQPFVEGLSSDPDWCRNKTLFRQDEILWSFLACFCIGPFALF